MKLHICPRVAETLTHIRYIVRFCTNQPTCYYRSLKYTTERLYRRKRNSKYCCLKTKCLELTRFTMFGVQREKNRASQIKVVHAEEKQRRRGKKHTNTYAPFDI